MFVRLFLCRKFYNCLLHLVRLYSAFDICLSRLLIVLFLLVVFDPPHIKRNSLGEITKRYGNLEGDWKEMIRQGFKECFRVLKPNGTLIFKWSEVQFPIKDILLLTEHKPLFGHKSGKKMNTHWVTFIKD